MEDKKEQVTLWHTSWVELLYVLKLNNDSLDVTQYRAGFEERPPDSGNFHIKPERVDSNLDNIIDHITRQLKMEGRIEAAIDKHHEIISIGPDVTLTKHQKQKILS